MEFTFDHAAQVVPDISEAVEWYRENLPGVTVLYQDVTWAFIEAGGAKLAFVVKDQHPDHLAWRVSRADLQILAVKHGCEIVPHRDGTQGFYLTGPAGKHIEVICYEGSKWEDGTYSKG